MHLDHVSYAVGPDGLAGTTQRLAELLGEKFVDGGVHPRFGTRNVVLPLVGDQYLEIVEVLDHPASDKAPFGQAVRVRSEAGGGWLGWVVAVDDIAPVEVRLGRDAVPGNRHRPDGIELRWRQIGIKGLIADPQLPFFV
ncbi:MAG: VOC family protein, partial [Nocardioidaceae bacterium]